MTFTWYSLVLGYIICGFVCIVALLPMEISFIHKDKRPFSPGFAVFCGLTWPFFAVVFVFLGLFNIAAALSNLLVDILAKLRGRHRITGKTPRA
jgi:hypothetical protein